MKKILVLGAGLRRIPHAIHVDINPKVNPDVVWDLTKFPWPFEDNTFKNVIAEHILEHIWTQGDVEGYFKIFREIWRICRNGAKVVCETPYAFHEIAYADIGHRSVWVPALYKFVSKREYKDAKERGTAMSQYGIDFDFSIESATLLSFQDQLDEGPGLLKVVLVAKK